MIGRLRPQFFDQRQHSHDQRAPADQQNSGNEDERDAAAQPTEQVENKGIRPRQQPFVIGQRRHHLRPRLAEQIRDCHKLVALRPQPLDDLRQRSNRMTSIAASIVQQNNVAAVSVCLRQNALDDGVGRSWRRAIGLAPVVRVDACADDRVSHRLRNRQQLHLARRFRLVVDAVRRPEQRGFHAEIAFQQQLGKAQLHLQFGFGQPVDVEFRMRERVVADLVAQRVLAFHDRIVLVRRFADYEKRSRSVFPLQHVQHFRSPLRIGAVVKRQGHFFRIGTHLFDPPRHRICREAFVVEKIGIRVVVKRPPPVLWRGSDAPDVAVTFQN